MRWLGRTVLVVMLVLARRSRAQDAYSVEGKVVLEVVAPPPRPAEPAPQPEAAVTEGQIRPFAPVHFESKGDAAKPDSLPALDAVAAVVLANPSIELLRIEAHTDSVASNNQALSQRRADWVRRYLMQRGVPGERLTARGFGASRPIASNDTSEGRQANRRVEFVIDQRREP